MTKPATLRFDEPFEPNSNGQMVTTVVHDDITYVCTIVEDEEQRWPWKEEDGHGDVRVASGSRNSWGYNSKSPGERPLNHPDRNENTLFYDWKGAMQKAKEEHWGFTGMADFAGTRKAKRAEAVRRDFEHLRRFVANEWRYVGVCVQAFDKDDNPITGKYDHSCWGVEWDPEREHNRLSDHIADEELNACYDAVVTLLTPETSSTEKVA